MLNSKTTFQNWVDDNYPIGERHKLATKAGLRENQVTRDYRNPNGLKMIQKYFRLLNKKTVTVTGIEYGMEVKLVNVKIR